MGNSAEAVHQILAQSSPVEANHTEDVFIFVPTGTGEKISVKVSVEICGQKQHEDLQCDIGIELEEVITKAMVGHFGFVKSFRSSEYKGNIRLA